MARPILILLLTVLFSACSVTAHPDRLPVVGSLIEGCLNDVNPIHSFGLSKLVQVDLSSTDDAVAD